MVKILSPEETIKTIEKFEDLSPEFKEMFWDAIGKKERMDNDMAVKLQVEVDKMEYQIKILKDFLKDYREIENESCNSTLKYGKANL